MELLFEFIFQLFFEFLLQAVFGVLVELGFRSFENAYRRDKHPVISTIAILIWGALAGAISLLVLPTMLITNPALRLLNLLVTPILLGSLMVVIGRLRQRKGQELIQLDRFWYAFAFAWAMAMVRFTWAH